MPLTPDDKNFLKAIYNNLKPEQALQPGDPRYEPVYERPGCDKPTEELLRKIQLSDGESTLYFSGFRGSGKTTELYRLSEQLRQQGYVVLYADAVRYINPAPPIATSELLIALAGVFSEALHEQGIDIAGETYWTRHYNWLQKPTST